MAEQSASNVQRHFHDEEGRYVLPNESVDLLTFAHNDKLSQWTALRSTIGSTHSPKLLSL